MWVGDTDKAAFEILFLMVVIVMTVVEEMWNNRENAPFFV
jgi:hypothetical protein